MGNEDETEVTPTPEVYVEKANKVEIDNDALGEAVATVVKESRGGARTTEFWLAIATSLLVVLNGIPMPEQYEGYVVAGLAAVYAISRGLAKKGVPHIEEGGL